MPLCSLPRPGRVFFVLYWVVDFMGCSVFFCAHEVVPKGSKNFGKGWNVQDVMPFFESAEAATRHAIEASGKDPKEVASALFPDKTVSAARTLLLNALNENRAERLTADQHIFVANTCKQYHWLYFAAFKCGHTRPEQITPEARTAKLQSALFARASDMAKVLREIEDLRNAIAESS